MTSEPVDILFEEDKPDDAGLAMHVLEKRELANRIEISRGRAEAIDYPKALNKRPTASGA